MPLVVAKIGGRPAHQILGSTLGAFLFACVVWLFQMPSLDAVTFIFSFISGIAWMIGQTGKYVSFRRVGVSKTMPLSTGLQIIGTSLTGVIIFNEWQGLEARLIGFAALGIIILGIVLTTARFGKKDRAKQGTSGNHRFIALITTTSIGYVIYSTIPGFLGTSGVAILLPQTLGMVVGALAYILITKNIQAFKHPCTWKNLISGGLFAIAALAYIVSANTIGVASAFVLSQMSVVIATLGAIFVLREKQHGFQLLITSLGLALVLAGSITTAFL